MNPPKGGSDEPLEKNGGEVPEKKRFHQFLGSMFRGGGNVDNLHNTGGCTTFNKNRQHTQC